MDKAAGEAKRRATTTASDTISSFGTEAIAKAISEGGGFGIAKQIVSKVTLEHQQNFRKQDFSVLKFLDFVPIHSSRSEVTMSFTSGISSLQQTINSITSTEAKPAIQATMSGQRDPTKRRVDRQCGTC